MTHVDQVNQKLKNVLQFNEHDLKLNRVGIISPAQIERVGGNLFDVTKWKRFIIGLMVGAFFISIAKEGFSRVNLQFVLMYIGFCIAGYFVFSYYFKNNANKLREGKYPVESIEGVVTLPENSNGSFNSLNQYGSAISMAERFSGINLAANNYLVQVGEKKIYTTQAIHDAFEVGRNYKIYLLRSVKQERQNILYGAVIIAAEAKE